MKQKQILFADLLLLGITFIWGTTFIVIQHVLDKLTPLAFNAWRFFAAALVLILWQALFGRTNRSRNGERTGALIGSGILLGLFLFAGYISQTISLLYTSAANAAFITGLNVVLIPIFSAFLLRIIPGKTAICGAVLAMIGLFFMTTGGQLTVNKGDFIALISAAAFAFHIIFTAKFTMRFNSLPLTIIQLATVSLCSFIAGSVFEGRAAFNAHILVQADVLAAILFMALFATAFAFLMQTRLQKITPATHVGIIYLMEPVFAAWTSIIFQHAHFGVDAFTGSCFIFIGMFLAEYPFGHKMKVKQAK